MNRNMLERPLRAAFRAKRRRCFMFCLVALASSTCLGIALPFKLYAQAQGALVGKLVMQKSANFRLKLGDRMIEVERGVVYRVRQVNGPWLLV